MIFMNTPPLVFDLFKPSKRLKTRGGVLYKMNHSVKSTDIRMSVDFRDNDHRSNNIINGFKI